jgi:hypothetical protein
MYVNRSGAGGGSSGGKVLPVGATPSQNGVLSPHAAEFWFPDRLVKFDSLIFYLNLKFRLLLLLRLRFMHPTLSHLVSSAVAAARAARATSTAATAAAPRDRTPAATRTV